MHFKDDIILSFQGVRWIASYNGYSFYSETLEELDTKLEDHIKARHEPAKGDIFTLSYLFDNSSIPEWIRQYSNHYFNRKVEFKF